MQWRASPGKVGDEVLGRLLAPPAELMLDALPPLMPQARLLEVQAGGGVMASALMERLAGLGRLVSIDDDDVLASALPSIPRRAAVTVAAVAALPFTTASFDVVMANLVLGADAADDARCLSELRRVLKPGGWLLASVMVRGSFERLLDLVDDVADDLGLDDVSAAVGVARLRLPEPVVMQERFRQAGLMVAQVGLEERLLGLYRGAMLLEDLLITDVVLRGVCGVSLPPSLSSALVHAVDGRYPAGLPVVVHSMVVTGRLERR